MIASWKGTLYGLNPGTLALRKIGPAWGGEVWLTDLSLDPTGTCIYFVVDSTWSGRASGVPVVRFDLDTGRRPVLCFLGPLLFANFGYVPVGGYTAVVDPEGRWLVMQLNGSSSRATPKTSSTSSRR
ncbi:MAG: hypothetical protein AAF800_07670 [Planctomycetota bacterium]